MPVSDPFATFDAATGAGKVRDPYPQFAELRAKGRIHEGSVEDLLGIESPLNMEYFVGAPRIFSVFRYDDVVAVLRDLPMSNHPYAVTMGPVMGHSLIEMNEPEHRRYRGLVQQAFSRPVISRWIEERVPPIVHRLVDGFADRGAADLSRELTLRFPVMVVASLLGLPEEDLPQFHAWAIGLMTVVADFDAGIAASQALRDYFAVVLADRRANPGDDLISALAEAELDGERLDDEEIYAFLRLLLPAGAETTYRSSGSLLWGLLTHPEQLAAVYADRALLPRAIEETVRWETPLTYVLRVATEDVEIDHTLVPKGSVVDAVLGSANRDPDRFGANADGFDVFRAALPHAAFGNGVHTCLGMHLARFETEAAVNVLLDRLPGLALDPDADDPHITGLMWRAPTAIPVLFDATRAR